MRDNQVTVTGPESPERVYSEIVNQLPYGKVLELADGRWGVRTLSGVVTFGSGGRHKDRISFLHILNDSVTCRVLSGTVEITYNPLNPTVSAEEIAAVMREEIAREKHSMGNDEERSQRSSDYA